MLKTQGKNYAIINIYLCKVEQFKQVTMRGRRKMYSTKVWWVRNISDMWETHIQDFGLSQMEKVVTPSFSLCQVNALTREVLAM